MDRMPVDVINIILIHLDPPGLLKFACCTKKWSEKALKTLYTGSINDMRYRTPELTFLSRLLNSSRQHYDLYMGFVRHLVLSDVTLPGYRNPLHPSPEYLRSIGACLSLYHPPEKEDPVSLAIPFDIPLQDFRSLLNLTLTPRLKFITMAEDCCEFLVSTYDSSALRDKLSGLKALSLFNSSNPLQSEELKKVLQNCDLELFNFTPRGEQSFPNQHHMQQFLQCLQGHQSLRALSLMVDCIDGSGASDLIASLDAKEDTVLWPQLQALYLEGTNGPFFEKLPKFEHLQILNTGLLLNEETRSFERAAKAIARCQNLVVVIMASDAYDSISDLITIARGCWHLRRFEISTYHTKRLGEEEFLPLVQALPNVELLTIGTGYKVKITLRTLRALAEFCPRLTALDIPGAKMLVSKESLVHVTAFNSLQVMIFSKITFQGSRPDLPSFTDEWKRRFPHLRLIPCIKDFPCWEDEDEDRELEREGFPKQPRPLSKDLWELLNYGYEEEFRNRFFHIWQTALEIQTFKWPVLSVDTYLDPINRSSLKADFTPDAG